MASTPPTTFFVSRNNASFNRPLNLMNVPKFKGRDNYEIWSIAMEAVWHSQQLGEVVLKGRKPEEKSSVEEMAAFNSLINFTVTIYIQVLSSDILKTVIQIKDPNLIWTHLQTQYQRNTAYALVFQLESFSQVATNYEPSLPISSFLDNFESEYFRLSKLAIGSADERRQLFARFP